MRAPSLSSAKLGARLKPEERPVYARRRIVGAQEIRFPLPPSVNRLFFNKAGKGRVKTTLYKAWRQEAAWLIDGQKPGRMAGPCAVAIYLPPCRGDIDHRMKPCLDAAVEAGVLADDGQRYVVKKAIEVDPSATDVRMVLTMLPIEEQDRAEIEVRAHEGQSCAHIAVSLGLDEGHVRTVLTEIGR